MHAHSVHDRKFGFEFFMSIVDKSQKTLDLSPQLTSAPKPAPFRHGGMLYTGAHVQRTHISNELTSVLYSYTYPHRSHIVSSSTALPTRTPNSLAPSPLSTYFSEMILSIVPSPATAAASRLSVPAPPPASARVPFAKGSTVACRAAGKGKKEEVVVSGVMFQPFEELKGELSLVPQADGQSLARQKFVDECEAGINEQIK